MKQIGKRFCMLTLFCLMASLAGASEVHKTVKDSYFFLAPSIYNPSQASKVFFDVFCIPAGTETELLSRINSSIYDYVRVRLQDGSIGYLPVFAYADASVTVNEASVTLSIDGNELPEGIYKVLAPSPWTYSEAIQRYKQYERLAIPANGYSLQGKKGKKYMLREDQKYDEVRISSKGNRYTAREQYYINRTFRFGTFQTVFDNLPVRGPGFNFIPTFSHPEQKDLNAFVGCSRSYLESLFGEAYAYVGPALSDIPNHTYALYQTVNKGIVVYYDDNLCASYIAYAPFMAYASGADPGPLFFPIRPLASPDKRLAPLVGTPSKYVPMKTEWSPVTEVLTKPKILDRLRIAIPLFFERTMGITSPFVILFLAVLFVMLWGLLVTVWIKEIFNYGSNGWEEARYFILTIPVAILVVLYFWRYPLLFTIFAAVLILPASYVPYFRIRNAILYKRCPECHKFCEPIILHTKEGKYNAYNYLANGQEELMETFGNSGDRGSYHDVYYVKYETTMKVCQDMTYDVQCPHCNHKWSYTRSENRPDLPGPIRIDEVHDERVVTETTTKTVTELRDGNGHLLDSDEEVQSGSSSEKYHYRGYRHDYDFFKPFFDDYVNGDKDALARYYRLRWNTIRWNDLWGIGKR